MAAECQHSEMLDHFLANGFDINGLYRGGLHLAVIGFHADALGFIVDDQSYYGPRCQYQCNNLL